MTTKTIDEKLPVIRHDEDGAEVCQVGKLEVRRYNTLPAPVKAFVVDVIDRISTSAEDAVIEILGGILNASTADDILDSGDVIHSETMVHRTFTVHGVRWARSTFTGGLPFYALAYITFTDPDGTERDEMLSCSATNVMAQLWQFDRLGLLPIEVKLTVSKNKTPDGYQPMRLVHPSAF